MRSPVQTTRTMARPRQRSMPASSMGGVPGVSRSTRTRSRMPMVLVSSSSGMTVGTFGSICWAGASAAAAAEKAAASPAMRERRPAGHSGRARRARPGEVGTSGVMPCRTRVSCGPRGLSRGVVPACHGWVSRSYELPVRESRNGRNAVPSCGPAGRRAGGYWPPWRLGSRSPVSRSAAFVVSVAVCAARREATSSSASVQRLRYRRRSTSRRCRWRVSRTAL